MNFKLSILDESFLFHLQANLKTSMASLFLPFESSHRGDSGRKYHKDIKGRAKVRWVVEFLIRGYKVCSMCYFCSLKTDIALGLQKLGIILDNKVFA